MKQMELNDSSVNVFTRDIILLKNNRDNHLKYFLIKISGHHKKTIYRMAQFDFSLKTLYFLVCCEFEIILYKNRDKNHCTRGNRIWI